MRNILRFLGIVIISAVILFSIGSFYDLPLMKIYNLSVGVLSLIYSFLSTNKDKRQKCSHGIKLLSNFGYLLSVLFLFLP
ncbi:Uncharacterised protein [Streptococcus pyogenes]|nr:Uncharacterised protein [Streptococcus pyogenes]